MGSNTNEQNERKQKSEKERETKNVTRIRGRIRNKKQSNKI